MFTQSQNLHILQHMSFTTTKTSQYKIKTQPDAAYLSTIESALVVLELLHKHKIETIKTSQLKNFLQPFTKMIAYQQALIANPQSHAVRFRSGASKSKK